MGTPRVEMKRVLPWLVHWTCCDSTGDFYSALAALVSQLKKKFPSPFTISIPLGRQPCWVACLFLCVSGHDIWFLSSRSSLKVWKLHGQLTPPHLTSWSHDFLNHKAGNPKTPPPYIFIGSVVSVFMQNQFVCYDCQNFSPIRSLLQIWTMVTKPQRMLTRVTSDHWVTIIQHFRL
jgi:hypothetical protein